MSSQASISALSFCRLLEIDVHNMLAKVQKKNLPPMRLENCRLPVSMFHACGLYVSCLRPLSATHGYDKGRIAFWGARKRLGALAVLCGFERRACKHRGCEAGLKHRGWVRAFGLVLFGRAFVGRSLGSCFGSFFSWFVLWVRAFWSFFSWFVLLVVLWVRAFGRSFVVRSSGSCFWGLVCVFCSML